jgi:putative salt-induced outer membrane protein YdiY
VKSKAMMLLAGVAMLFGTALAQDDAPKTTIELDSGDRIMVEVVGETETEIFVRSDVLGEFTIDKERVVTIVRPEGAEPSPETDALISPAEPEVEKKESLLDAWNFSAEAGINGSDGNTERLNLRLGVAAERDVEETFSRLSLTFVYATESGDKTESRFIARGRHDWKFVGSPWRAFVEGSAIRDEFQDWDWEVAAHGGFGYAFIENDSTLLLARFGGGASRQFGGENTSIRPEGLLGLDFNHNFNERHGFVSSVTYYPRLDDFDEFRVHAMAAYNVALDDDGNLSFRIGIEDRYDSEPGGDSKRNDIDYFALLVYSF